MKNQEYLVRKYNAQGYNYYNRHYSTYAEAWADTTKLDEMLVCKPNSVYYGDNWESWTVKSTDIIRVVTR